MLLVAVTAEPIWRFVNACCKQQLVLQLLHAMQVQCTCCFGVSWCVCVCVCVLLKHSSLHAHRPWALPLV